MDVSTGSNVGRIISASTNSTLALGQLVGTGGIITAHTAGAERLRIGSSGQIGIGGASYGTSGQVLTSAGASAAPSWQSLPAPADGSITYAKLSTSATESENVANRVAKAWVNFNGTGTVAIRDDFNVSTVADNGTGDYTINFSSNMSGTKYCVAIGVASQSFPSTPEAGTTKSTSSCSIKTVTVQNISGDNKTPVDNASVHAVIFE
jgi:hypothetical protein